MRGSPLGTGPLLISQSLIYLSITNQSISQLCYHMRGSPPVSGPLYSEPLIGLERSHDKWKCIPSRERTGPLTGADWNQRLRIENELGADRSSLWRGPRSAPNPLLICSSSSPESGSPLYSEPLIGSDRSHGGPLP